MKNLITIILLLVAVGCASTPTIKSVAGTYDFSDLTKMPTRIVFLDEQVLSGISRPSYRPAGTLVGVAELYTNDKKDDILWDWYIIGNEVHIESIFVRMICRVKTNGDLTWIAGASKSDLDMAGKRKAIPQEKQRTFKKIN